MPDQIGPGRFGFAPAGATAEQTWDEYYSTRTFAVATALPVVMDFFNPATQAPAPYSNFQLPSPNSLPVTVIGFKLEYSAKLSVTTLGNTNTGLEVFYQQFMEQNSILRWVRERKGVTGLPLPEILDYNFYNLASSATSVANEKKEWSFFRLPKSMYIDIPAGGRVSFFIEMPGASLTTAAAGSAYLPLLGLTNNLGMFFRLKLFCLVTQQLV